MINGLEGIPGSGKSYEAAAHQIMAALQAGTLVITNLPLNVEKYASIDPSYRALIELRKSPRPILGTWDAARVDTETGEGNAFALTIDGTTRPAPENVQPFGHVWDYYTEWKHPKTGRGPLFVIDEAHEAMPDIGTDPQVISWYKLHRHFNVDVLLMTQSFRDMNQKICRLMGMVIKVRKADILGKPDHYIRKVHAGYRGAVISTEERKYKPEYFELYKSHTQGNSVAESAASDVAPLSVKLKKATRITWGIAAVAIGFAVWVGTKDKPAMLASIASKSAYVKPNGQTDYAALQPALDQPRPHTIATPAAAAPAGASSAPEAQQEDPAPYDGKKLHITGRMSMKGRTLYSFAVSAGGTMVTDITSDDLAQIGYTYQPLTDCAGYLRWKKTVAAVICDAPNRASGLSEKPIVMYDGHRSDGKPSPDKTGV